MHYEIWTILIFSRFFFFSCPKCFSKNFIMIIEKIKKKKQTMVQLYWTGCLPLTIHKRDPTTAEHEVFDLLAIRASAGSTFLRRPGKRDSSTLTMSMPSFVRTLDQHRTTTNRTPARKSFTQPDPRSSSGYRKTPRFPVDEESHQSTIYTEII